MAAAPQGFQQQGLDQGKGKVGDDKLGMFLKVFAGEVLTAFTRRSVTVGKVQTRTIKNGKSASFPVMGRTKGYYLAVGEDLDTKRKDIKHSEKIIVIDGLLVSDVLIADLWEAMNHYDVRAEYTAQMGEALALSTDGAHFAECAIMCNLAAGSDENIAGLGKPTVIPFTAAVGDETDSAKVGNEFILALTKIRAAFTKNYVPPSERYVFTTPEIYSAILFALSPVAANWPALIDLETGNIRNVVGFEVIEVPHLTIGGAGDDHEATNQKHVFPATGNVTTTNVRALVWHKSAIGHLKLRDMAIERGRRINYQGDQIVAKMAVGHGGLRTEACGAIVKNA